MGQDHTQATAIPPKAVLGGCFRPSVGTDPHLPPIRADLEPQLGLPILGSWVSPRRRHLMARASAVSHVPVSRN